MQQTHYDTLKVSRDAPIEVIRAAYRALSQKYHPDRNPADSAAADTMGLLNNAYEVLSDPERRHAHDAWIRYVEVEALYVHKPDTAAPRPERVEPEQDMGADGSLRERMGPHLRQFGLLYGGALLVASVATVISVVHRPQESPWLVATPSSEDRETTIRRLASEVMLRPNESVKPPVSVAPTPRGSTSPSNGPSASAMEREESAKAAVRAGDDMPRPNRATRAAAHPREAPTASTDLPAFPSEDPPIVRPSPPNHIRAAGKPLPDQNEAGK